MLRQTDTYLADRTSVLVPELGTDINNTDIDRKTQQTQDRRTGAGDWDSHTATQTAQQTKGPKTGAGAWDSHTDSSTDPGSVYRWWDKVLGTARLAELLPRYTPPDPIFFQHVFVRFRKSSPVMLNIFFFLFFFFPSLAATPTHSHNTLFGYLFSDGRQF